MLHTNTMVALNRVLLQSIGGMCFVKPNPDCDSTDKIGLSGTAFIMHYDHASTEARVILISICLMSNGSLLSWIYIILCFYFC